MKQSKALETKIKEQSNEINIINKNIKEINEDYKSKINEYYDYLIKEENIKNITNEIDQKNNKVIMKELNKHKDKLSYLETKYISLNNEFQNIPKTQKKKKEHLNNEINEIKNEIENEKNNFDLLNNQIKIYKRLKLNLENTLLKLRVKRYEELLKEKENNKMIANEKKKSKIFIKETKRTT